MDYNAGIWYTPPGYWDNTTGRWDDTSHLDTTDYGYLSYYDENGIGQGYWTYDTDGVTSIWVPTQIWIVTPIWVNSSTWVPVPTWVPEGIPYWIAMPTWVQDGVTSTTLQVWYSVSLSLTGDPTTPSNPNYNVSLIAQNTSNPVSPASWNGSYNIVTGVYSGTLPSFANVNTDGSSWQPPPPEPPPNASFGPPTLWVDGTVYSWTSSTFDNVYQTSGKDHYSDGNGHSAWVSKDSSGHYSSSFGGYANGVFDDSDSVAGSYSSPFLDARAADSGGHPIYGTAPSDMPPAFRLQGSSSSWQYLGLGSRYHCYAGSLPGQRLFIDTVNPFALCTWPWFMNQYCGGDCGVGLFKGGVVWASGGISGTSTVRGVSLDGSVWRPAMQPALGPPDVWVNGTVWHYSGSWDPSWESDGYFQQVRGDHYLGPNFGQELVIVDPVGHVRYTNAGTTSQGTYASPDGTAPRQFQIAGVEVYPGDLGGTYHKTQRSFGPPNVWVNGTLFEFLASNEDPAQLGRWVDSYTDASHNRVEITPSAASGYAADESLLWSGQYVPVSSNPSDGGVFVLNTGNGLLFDVRPYNGSNPFPPAGAPHDSHPFVVKVDGVPYQFGGSTGTSPTDYYFGSSAGQRLSIDSTGAVTFSQDITSHAVAGTGSLVANVFLVVPNTHDLRACTSDNLPVPATGSPHWGPPAMWVEGTVWSYIGTVSDDTLQIHADYYGGFNVGQVLKINNSEQVSGSYTGTYAGSHSGGVFLAGAADLRALDATGTFLTAPAQDRPATLRIGGLHWQFLGSAGGNYYYASDQAGQRLSMASDGSVVYSDRPANVTNATGSYNNSNDSFTAQSGGVAFNAGTVAGDLDILGDVLSLGSLADDKNTAGMTMGFRDDIDVAGHRSASMALTISRPDASWVWAHATTVPNATQSMMLLDSTHRLGLFDPAATTPNAAPSVLLDPGLTGTSQLGNTTISGVLIIEHPAGGISMGGFGP